MSQSHKRLQSPSLHTSPDHRLSLWPDCTSHSVHRLGWAQLLSLCDCSWERWSLVVMTVPLTSQGSKRSRTDLSMKITCFSYDFRCSYPPCSTTSGSAARRLWGEGKTPMLGPWLPWLYTGDLGGTPWSRKQSLPGLRDETSVAMLAPPSFVHSQMLLLHRAAYGPFPFRKQASLLPQSLYASRS